MGRCKTSKSKRGTILNPRAMIWATSVEVYMMKLHTKDQRPRPSGFRQEDFLSLQLKDPNS